MTTITAMKRARENPATNPMDPAIRGKGEYRHSVNTALTD
jgi:hypothetical protein